MNKRENAQPLTSGFTQAGAQLVRHFVSNSCFRLSSEPLQYPRLREAATTFPNGILSFIPSQVFLKYTGFTQKKGLFFDLRLSYRYKDVNDFVPLFETKIEVLFDSFENSGELAAKDFFNKMVKEKYLAL